MGCLKWRGAGLEAGAPSSNFQLLPPPLFLVFPFSQIDLNAPVRNVIIEEREIERS